MLTAGIDAGSRTIKVVLLESRRMEVLATGLADQGLRPDELATALLERVLADAGVPRHGVSRCVATGYARGQVSQADATLTEITCHACGVRRVLPRARTVIDIGGQDSKVIRLDVHGTVEDFVMNDRCAAGTGRFLELVAARLATDVVELGRMAAAGGAPAAISSMCAVFAETEIIGLLAGGSPPADISAGVQQAVARRVAAMAGGRAHPPVAFTGGVALVAGMAGAMERALGCPVSVARDPQMTGALGAAILAIPRAGR
jgi:predicted CoA-substrate-specific enzyme activase